MNTSHHPSCAPALALALAGAPMSFGQPTPQSALTPPAQAQAPAQANRLATESSPYLRQHAHNPVDWYPWGDEAFAEARRRQVPIFLSIGYSTCYWCHVMERESFENPEIARLLNESFVCIKVDREERPDVDDIYMAAVLAMAGRGGWPMSVWLNPPPPDEEGVAPQGNGLEPFYAGTYFPSQPRQGMPSLPQVVANINEAWKQDRDAVITQGKHVAEALRAQSAWEPQVKIGTQQVSQAITGLLNIHDPNHGGFGNAPKFPQPVFLDFLMELTGRVNNPAVAGSINSSTRLTLDKMALGGMYDQLAGGFHRYSTDATWTVPHFEKMLYDNAMLISVYARSYTQTRDPFDAMIVRETVNYCLREMQDAETGAFYSAQDAEVDGREGLNYLWTRPELTEVLGEDDAVFAARVLGFDNGTNFQDPHHPEDRRKNVLFMPQRPDILQSELKMAPEAFAQRLASVKARLLEARSKRKQPHLDDKVITSWNGLMIGALADASLALGDLDYLDQAERTGKFFLVNMRTKTGGLFRTYRDTRAKTAGFLEDYAFVVQGLLKVHLASAASGRADTRYLLGAEDLTRISLERFSARDGTDPSGMLFDTRADQPDLIVRSATTHDGAMPSGQGVTLHNLLDIYLITRKREHLDRAVSLARALSGEVASSPLGCINSTRACLRLLGLKPDAFDNLPEPQTAQQTDTELDTDGTVQVHADTDRVVVPKQGQPPAVLRLKLVIDQRFHINAHDPGVEGMTGLAVRVEGGSGVNAEVEYPAATKYTGGALPEGEGPLMVHAGEAELVVRLSASGQPWQGRPLLVLTYQACDDRACMKPETVSLDVALDPG